MCICVVVFLRRVFSSLQAQTAVAVIFRESVYLVFMFVDEIGGSCVSGTTQRQTE